MSSKWRIFLGTLPIVGCVVAAAVVRDQVIGYHGFLDFGDMGPVLTAGAFLIGFMLSGVMSDYKESEKIPAELACTLETIEEHLTIASIKTKLDTRPQQRRLLELTAVIERWMHQEASYGEVVESLHAFAEVANDLERVASFFAGKVLSELSNIRKTITRIHVISSTTFLQAGYALLDIVVGAVIVLLLCARWKSGVAEYTLITCITLVYVYMLRLIRDVDSPFEHTRDGELGGAEVDLSPLKAYLARSRSRRTPRLATEETLPNPPVPTVVVMR